MKKPPPIRTDGGCKKPDTIPLWRVRMNTTYYYVYDDDYVGQN